MPGTATPMFLLGQNLTSLNLYPGTQNAAGTLSWGSAINFAANARFGGFNLSFDAGKTQINSVDDLFMHYVRTLTGWSMSLTEVLLTDSNGLATFNIVAAGNTHAKVTAGLVLQAGTKTLTFQGLIDSASSSFSSVGENTAVLQLASINTGQSNLIIS